VDAWFDVTTSGSRTQTLEALLLAVLVEIPAALFTLYLAHQVNRRVLELAKLDGYVDTRRRRRSRRRDTTVLVEEVPTGPVDQAQERDVSG
jgi:hypothetical protein